MHDDEDGEVEHVSAHDLEQRLKLRKYLWIGVTFSNLDIHSDFSCM